MNKKAVVSIVAIVLAVVLLALVGCVPPPPIDRDDDGMGIVKPPDNLDDKVVDTDEDTDSWLTMGDEELTIDWWVEQSAWNPPTGVDAISQKIKDVTGITINFNGPVSDDGQKLGAMIANNSLPDVLTIPTSNTTLMMQLASDGYIYDINQLADKFAPSLRRNLSKDIWDWWAMGNGKTYGIPNHYYSYDDVPEGQLQPNGGMMVRKDLFDKWQEVAQARADSDGMITYTGRTDGQEKKVPWQGYITTPEGFKEAAKWAMDNYYGNGSKQITTGLQLAQFKNEGCVSLTWLAQFFAIPFEDEQGNYVYQFTTEAYENMLYYLNDLYTEGIISPGNFNQNYDAIGSVIAGGKAFATLVTPQDYQMHYVTAQGSGCEYVTLYITNEKGDAPVLADIRGYGYMFNMITTKCKRPDLVIKLFDYLSSDEGQRLVTLGVEGDTWNWKDESKTEIVFTQKYLSDKAKGETAKYGLMMFDLLLNYQYYDNIQPRTDNGKTPQELFRTNLKRPLTIYAYDYNVTHFVITATGTRLNKYNTSLQRINQELGTAIPQIIMAKDNTAAKKQYDTTVKTLNDSSRNLPLVIEMNAQAYQATKAKLGITGAAWPAWQKDYVSPLNRLMPNGDLTLYRSY